MLLTQFTNCKFNITTPLALDVDMSFRQLTLSAGDNGIGKSFLNKMLFSIQTFASTYLLEKTHGIKLNEEFSTEDTLQWILDNTFNDQDFNGEIKFYNLEPITGVPWEYLTFVLIDGKVSELTIDFMKYTEAAMPTYLSSATRQFSALENFVSIKSLLGIKQIEKFEEINKLCEHFPLYDVFAIEKIIASFSRIEEIFKTLKDMGSELVDEFPNITYIKVKNNKIVVDLDGKETSITNLGAGNQALLIMFLGSM